MASDEVNLNIEEHLIDSDEELLKEVFAIRDEPHSDSESNLIAVNVQKSHFDNEEAEIDSDADLDDEEMLKDVFAFDNDELHKDSSNFLDKKSKKIFTSKREKKLMKFVFGDKDNLIKRLDPVVEKQQKKTKRKRVAVWHDSDDETLTSETVLKTKKQEPLYTSKTTTENYKSLLEKNLKRIVGTPTWANIDKINQPDSDDEILQTIGHLAKVKTKSLQKKVLNFKKLNSLNRTSLKEGPVISSIEFHPTSTVAVVTGKTGVATLFTVDGHKNEKIHSMLLKDFLIQTCRFNKNGNELVFGGNKNYIYSYDLLIGNSLNIRLPKFMTNMSKFEISPNGEYIVTIGKYGELFILNQKTKEHMGTLKQEYPSTNVTFSSDSTKIFSHSDNNEVTIFDTRTNKMLHRFIDDGCLAGTTISLSPNGNLLACGSKEGVVNCYNYNDVFSTKYPKPVKSLLNITTGISCIKFNHSSEILAYCSNQIDDSLKMVHFPSATVFSNVPEFQSGLGKPNVLSFSPGGKYFAVGNMYKNVSLYSLGHFTNY